MITFRPNQPSDRRTAVPLSPWALDRTSRPPLAVNLDELLASFTPITLGEMCSVELLNRVDTKYLIPMAQLANILQALRSQYAVLTIKDHRLHNYRTTYYDTPAFDLYHDHVTRRAFIYKIRCREYVDTGMCYLEVKRKNQKERTEKSRVPVACAGCRLDGEMSEFLRRTVPRVDSGIAPVLVNTFRRITLVNLTGQERLTIDVDLGFAQAGRQVKLAGVAVAEIKQPKFCRDSAFIKQMRRLHLQETGFSKYCFGVSQLYDTVKKNSQKEKLLLIEKLSNGGHPHVCFA